MHEYSCAVVSILILCFFLVLRIFWEEQLAEQFWYFNFSLYLVVFGQNSKKSTLHVQVTTHIYSKQGQSHQGACTSYVRTGGQNLLPRLGPAIWASIRDQFHHCIQSATHL